MGRALACSPTAATFVRYVRPDRTASTTSVASPPGTDSICARSLSAADSLCRGGDQSVGCAMGSQVERDPPELCQDDLGFRLCFSFSSPGDDALSVVAAAAATTSPNEGGRR
jgi:hypothetical protein